MTRIGTGVPYGRLLVLVPALAALGASAPALAAHLGPAPVPGAPQAEPIDDCELGPVALCLREERDDAAAESSPSGIELDLGCTDDANSIFAAAVGTCDDPGAALPPPLPAAQDAPSRAPALCDGPSCLPQQAPLAQVTFLLFNPQPLAETARPRPPGAAASRLVATLQGGPRPGFPRTIDRPPRG